MERRASILAGKKGGDNQEEVLRKDVPPIKSIQYPPNGDTVFTQPGTVTPSPVQTFQIEDSPHRLDPTTLIQKNLKKKETLDNVLKLIPQNPDEIEAQNKYVTEYWKGIEKGGLPKEVLIKGTLSDRLEAGNKGETYMKTYGITIIAVENTESYSIGEGELTLTVGKLIFQMNNRIYHSNQGLISLANKPRNNEKMLVSFPNEENTPPSEGEFTKIGPNKMYRWIEKYQKDYDARSDVRAETYNSKIAQERDLDHVPTNSKSRE